MTIGNLKDNQFLCMKLFEAESENEIIQILKKYDLWDNPHYWRPFGDNENNWSVIGNQQGNPVAALVEKFVNSIDAMLILNCHLRGIRPDSNRAPKSIAEAVEEFFEIKNGNLTNITPSQRRVLSENIGFVATGRKHSPNYIIFDHGEGQTPKSMPDTLLSLTKSNKQKIHFVQGKFNMGGTGVLPFCGKHNFQLIISKRHPEIISKDDDTSSLWGFTLVRREEPRQGRRSSMFTYLAFKQQIMTFKMDQFLFPEYAIGTQDISPLKWGTIIKLYEYEMTGLKTNINLDPYYHISLLLPKPGLPIRFYERREKYVKSHSPEITMHGLHVRLQEDKRDNLEPGFPTSHVLAVTGQSMIAEVYAFKANKSSNYRTNEGVVFIINGQTHGYIPQRFFSSKRINMGYIADSLLVLVDASNLSSRSREDLFMNSRDRVRKGDLYNEIENALTEQLSNHQGLRELREKRRREIIDDKLTNSKPLVKVLEDILKKSPTLQKLFVEGLDIGNPTKSKMVGESDKPFIGKPFPSFFQIYPKDVSKPAHINLRFRVQFQTDVENSYFGRDEYPGKFELYHNDILTRDYVLNLWNGTATLTVALPEDTQIGSQLHYYAKISDDTGNEFINEFSRDIVNAIDVGGHPGGAQKTPDTTIKGNRPTSEQFSLPQVIEVREEQWDVHNFDKYSALKVVRNENKTFDFYVNVDNVYLRNELKFAPKSKDLTLIESQFKFALVLIGLAILQDDSFDENNLDDDTVQPEDRVFSISKSIAPIIIPMIDSLGDLKPDDLNSQEMDFVD